MSQADSCWALRVEVLSWGSTIFFSGIWGGPSSTGTRRLPVLRFCPVSITWQPLHIHLHAAFIIKTSSQILRNFKSRNAFLEIENIWKKMYSFFSVCMGLNSVRSVSLVLCISWPYTTFHALLQVSSQTHCLNHPAVPPDHAIMTTLSFNTLTSNSVPENRYSF